MTTEEIYQELIQPKPTVTGRIANSEPELQDFVQKHMTTAITNAYVGVDYSEIEKRMLIVDDVIAFPDMLPYENDVLESIIASGLGLSGLFMQEPVFDRHYHMPDFIAGDRAYDLKLHDPEGYGKSFYQRRQTNPAPRVTPRDKVLAKRAKDKANRKRARK